MAARYRDHLGSAVEEAEFLNRLRVGGYVSVFYRDDDVWHQRLLLWKPKGSVSRWVIYTPDGDLYEEDLAGDPANGVARVVLHSGGGDRPRCLRRSYRFRILPSEEEAKGLVVRARALLGPQCALASELGEACRLDGTQCGIYHYVPEEASELAFVGTWRVLDLVEGYRVGTEIPDDCVVVRHRRVGLAVLGGKTVKVEQREPEDIKVWLESAKRHADIGQNVSVAETDIRTLAVEFDSSGKRYKAWRTVCEESFTEGLDACPLEGPISVLSLARHFEVHGTNPRDWLQMWCRDKGLDGGERVCHELRTLTDILSFAGTFDQVNIGSLMCLEVCARRIQLLCDVYSNPQKPNWEAARLFTGLPEVGDVVTRELRNHVAQRAQMEANILKARVKMREAKQNDEGGGSGKPKGLPKAKAEPSPKGG
eukprot:342789-Amphidinium_carterae.2